MKNKKQILMIGGGSTLKSRKDYLKKIKNKKSISIEKIIKWQDEYLEKSLGQKFFIIRPDMPLKEDAKYEEWKIFFEKYIPNLKRNVILIGISLGGIFLAKYLSENKFSKKILATFLICPPFDNTCPGNDLLGGFKLKLNLFLLEKNSKNLFLMFSENDPIVPISHAEKYGKKLKNAKIIIYKNKNGHFNVAKFPEIVKIIKKLK